MVKVRVAVLTNLLSINPVSKTLHENHTNFTIGDSLYQQSVISTISTINTSRKTENKSELTIVYVTQYQQ